MFDISSFIFVHLHWNRFFSSKKNKKKGKKRKKHIDRKQPVILKKSAVSRQLLQCWWLPGKQEKAEFSMLATRPHRQTRRGIEQLGNLHSSSQPWTGLVRTAWTFKGCYSPEWSFMKGATLGLPEHTNQRSRPRNRLWSTSRIYWSP